MDPTLAWDKSFLSPSSSKTSKASLNDRATFWLATSIELKDQGCINPYRCTSKQPAWTGDINKSSKKNCDHGIKAMHQFSKKCIKQGVLLDEADTNGCVVTTSALSDSIKGDLADLSNSRAHVIVLDSDTK